MALLKNVSTNSEIHVELTVAVPRSMVFNLHNNKNFDSFSASGSVSAEMFFLNICLIYWYITNTLMVRYFFGSSVAQDFPAKVRKVVQSLLLTASFEFKSLMHSLVLTMI